MTNQDNTSAPAPNSQPDGGAYQTRGGTLIPVRHFGKNFRFVDPADVAKLQLPDKVALWAQVCLKRLYVHPAEALAVIEKDTKHVFDRTKGGLLPRYYAEFADDEEICAYAMELRIQKAADNTRLYIRGFPREVDTGVVLKELRPFGAVCEVYRPENQGYMLVKMRNADAERAVAHFQTLERDGKPVLVQGRILHVAKARTTDE